MTMMKALWLWLSRHRLLGAIFAVAMVALGVGAIAIPPSYITGVDFNHTVRYSPTSGPPSENNAWEVYEHFSGPASYAPTAILDKNGNLIVQSCIGCVSPVQCVAPTGCVSGYNPATGLPNCTACGGSGPSGNRLLIQTSSALLIQTGSSLLIQ
jgi:hypothetical protein